MQHYEATYEITYKKRGWLFAYFLGQLEIATEKKIFDLSIGDSNAVREAAQRYAWVWPQWDLSVQEARLVELALVTEHRVSIL